MFYWDTVATNRALARDQHFVKVIAARLRPTPAGRMMIGVLGSLAEGTSASWIREAHRLEGGRSSRAKRHQVRATSEKVVRVSACKHSTVGARRGSGELHFLAFVVSIAMSGVARSTTRMGASDGVPTPMVIRGGCGRGKPVQHRSAFRRGRWPHIPRWDCRRSTWRKNPSHPSRDPLGIYGDVDGVVVDGGPESYRFSAIDEGTAGSTRRGCL